MAQCSSSGKSVDSWHPSQLRLEQVHPIPPTAGFLDRSVLYGVLAHVEMLGLGPGRGPAGHTKTAGHPTLA
jgi:hypothetical protein